MTDTHQPTDTYRSFLEWQIQSQLRRRERFAPAPVPRSRRVVTAAALIIVSVLVGAGGTLAADRLGDRQRRELLLEQARLRLETATAQAQLLEQRYREREAQSRAGVVSTREVLAARERWQAARERADLARLDLEETTATGVSPRDDLSAPLIGGRDFVRERLEVRLERAAARRDTVRVDGERLQALFEAGMVSSTEVLRQQPQRIETEQSVELLRSRLELRRRFLAGELTASQVEREEQVEQATCSLAALGARRESLQAQVTRLEQLHAAGAVSSGELQQARADLAAVELDLRLLELELRILQDQ